MTIIAVRRLLALLGVVSVAPWLYVSVQGLRDDAPDGTYRSMLSMLVVQSVLVIAFVVSWFAGRPAALVAAGAVVAYAGVVAFGAADNGGNVLLAPVVFALVPGLAAAALVALPSVRPAGVPTSSRV